MIFEPGSWHEQPNGLLCLQAASFEMSAVALMRSLVLDSALLFHGRQQTTSWRFRMTAECEENLCSMLLRPIVRLLSR